MATKAERYRSEMERSGASTKKRARVTAAAGSKPSLGRKAVFELEQVAPTASPSRKSTRKSKHRQKAATTLTGRNLLEKSSPQNRHDMGRPRMP
jgi:hypothetical protein